MIKKVIIEIPIGWGHQNQTKMFIYNIINQISGRNIPVSIVPVRPETAFAPRRPPRGVLLFSFHSNNNSKNTWTIKESPIVNLCYFDKNGYSGWSDIAINYEEYRDEVEKLTNEEVDGIIEGFFTFFENTGESKYSQKKTTKLPSKYIFFPLQVRNDSVASLENLDPMDVLDELVRNAREKEFPVVIKRHPYCNSQEIKKKLRLLSQNEPYVIVVDDNIHSLIKGAHAIIACNSGVSMEALIYNKPVYCFGGSEWYRITNKVENLDDVKNVFSPEQKKLSPEGKKVVAYLLSIYWVRFDDNELLSKKIERCIEMFDPNDGVEYIESNIVELYGSMLLQSHATLGSMLSENFLLRKENKGLLKINKKLEVKHNINIITLIKAAINYVRRKKITIF